MLHTGEKKMSQTGEKKKIERRKTIEYGETTKWSGDKRTVHTFKEQLYRNLIKAKIDINFQIKERPDGIIDMLDRYNGGHMDLNELNLEGGIQAVSMWQKQVEVFEKNKKEAQEQGNMAMNIFEIMTGGEVKKVTKAIRERGEGIQELSEVSLVRMRKVMEIIEARYAQEDMATRMKVQAEMEQIGQCESHQDVQVLIEVLEEYQEELEQIAGMQKMSEMEMVHQLTKRLPKTSFYTQMVEVIAGMQIRDIKWDEVVQMRQSKIAVLEMIGRSTEEEGETDIKTVNMTKEESKKEQWQGTRGDKDSRRGGNGYGNTRGRNDYGRSDYGKQGRGYERRVCHQWTNNGHCRFGGEYRFEHDKADRKKETGKGNVKGINRVNATQQCDSDREEEDEEEGDSDDSNTRKRKVLENMISTAQEELIAMRTESPNKKKKA